MNTKYISALSILIGSTFVAGVAAAQEKDQVQAASAGRNLDPVKNAVELTIGTGYAQGFGNITAAQPSLTEVGTAGGAVQLGVGYRIIPQLTLGVYGSGSAFGRADEVSGSAHLYSATAGFDSAWHFLPSHSEWDPWVSLGTGWRGYWVQEDQGQTAVQGWEIAKLQTGVDFRIDKSIAISPVVGADLTTFFSQQTPESNGYASIRSPQVNTFLFAGLQGRFDVPTGSGASQVASR
jgi:hypothetical protein